jgi:hypothetical protein
MGNSFLCFNILVILNNLSFSDYSWRAGITTANGPSKSASPSLASHWVRLSLNESRDIPPFSSSSEEVELISLWSSPRVDSFRRRTGWPVPVSVSTTRSWNLVRRVRCFVETPSPACFERTPERSQSFRVIFESLSYENEGSSISSSTLRTSIGVWIDNPAFRNHRVSAADVHSFFGFFPTLASTNHWLFMRFSTTCPLGSAIA